MENADPVRAEDEDPIDGLAPVNPENPVDGLVLVNPEDALPPANELDCERFVEDPNEKDVKGPVAGLLLGGLFI